MSLETDIIAALDDADAAGEPMDPRELCNQLGADRNDLYKALCALIDSHEILVHGDQIDDDVEISLAPRDR